MNLEENISLFESENFNLCSEDINRPPLFSAWSLVHTHDKDSSFPHKSPVPYLGDAMSLWLTVLNTGIHLPCQMNLEPHDLRDGPGSQAVNL